MHFPVGDGLVSSPHLAPVALTLMTAIHNQSPLCSRHTTGSQDGASSTLQGPAYQGFNPCSDANLLNKLRQLPFPPEPQFAQLQHGQ